MKNMQKIIRCIGAAVIGAPIGAIVFAIAWRLTEVFANICSFMFISIFKDDTTPSSVSHHLPVFVAPAIGAVLGAAGAIATALKPTSHNDTEQKLTDSELVPGLAAEHKQKEEARKKQLIEDFRRGRASGREAAATSTQNSTPRPVADA